MIFQNLKTNKLKNLDILFYTILLFLAYISLIGNAYPFCNLDDEFGYWSNAAYFSGLDWSSVTSQTAYYSYGYSILLTPLFWVFDNPLCLYRAGVILNVFILIGGFFICLNITDRLAPELKKSLRRLISFCIFMYPSYIYQSKLAWSECTLIFVFWAITWCIFYISSGGVLSNKSSYKRTAVLVLTGILSVYMYMVHQRSIGVLISTILVIFILKVCKKISFKEFVYYFVTILVMIVLAKFIKDNVKDNLWLNSNSSKSNDYLTQVYKIKSLFSPQGIINFVCIFFGHSFYSFAATGLSVYFALYFLVNDIITKLKEKILQKKEILKINDNFFLYCFLVLSFLSTLLISVIFMINPIGVDEIIYGRYIEMIIGPLMLIGFLNILNNFKINKKSFIMTIIIFSMITFIVYFVVINHGLVNFNRSCAVSIYPYPANGNYYNILKSGIVSIFIYSILFIITKFNLRKFVYIYFIVLSIFFARSSILNIGNGYNSYEHNEEYLYLQNYINSSDEQYPIYYLIDDDFWNNRVARIVQFYLPNKNLQCVDYETLKNNNENKFLFVYKTSIGNIPDLSLDYELCESFKIGYLFKTKNIKDNKKISSIPIKELRAIDEAKIDKNGSIISPENDVSNVSFIYGPPHLSLEKGDYKININTELIKGLDDYIGYFEIVSGSEQIAKVDLRKDMFKDGKTDIQLNFSLPNRMEKIEIKAFAAEKNIVKINFANFVFN